MLSTIYYNAKSFVRPLTQNRRLLERMKYLGSPILTAPAGNDLICESLGRPIAIGKIGAGEMAALRQYFRRADSNGHCATWRGHAPRNLHQIAGVYPPEPAVFSKFCRTFIESLTKLDILAVWFNFGEHAAWRRFAPHATLTRLRALEPFYHAQPWTQKLDGRRVLVVTPFVSTIESQYRRRREIWAKKPGFLPDFDLQLLRVPLSAYISKPEYPDWFAALDAMCAEMSSREFDIAIVGAGAWSLPLVAHAKSLGRWAIHLGGSTQILFGIRGRRFDANDIIMQLVNESWVRPSAAETPQRAQVIEGGCYW